MKDNPHPEGARFHGETFPWYLNCGTVGNDFHCLMDAEDHYISDACVEGNTAEFREMAQALRKRQSFDAKRCAVDFLARGAVFYSPRNTQGSYAELPLELVDALADEIDAALNKHLHTSG